MLKHRSEKFGTIRALTYVICIPKQPGRQIHRDRYVHDWHDCGVWVLQQIRFHVTKESSRPSFVFRFHAIRWNFVYSATNQDSVKIIWVTCNRVQLHPFTFWVRPGDPSYSRKCASCFRFGDIVARAQPGGNTVLWWLNLLPLSTLYSS